MPEAFHFQQPAWFLALLPLALLIWRVRRHGSADSAWRRVCDANLLPYLLINPLRAESRWPLWLLAAGWLIAVIALADPVWEKMPQPVFRTEAARVVVLDLSRSMNSADLKPSRLERARYKVEDVLRRSEEGQVGLVVFAGDAFVVAPLTQDARTITEQLKALEPGLMPVQGSRVDRGLRKAGELLKQAGAGRGEILLMTDGYEGDQALEAARELQRQGDTVSVLGVGTKEGAPLSDGAGGFVQDDKGTVVVPRLDVASLRALANAGGGRYATITGNNADLNALLTPLVPRLNAKVEQTGLKTDAWRSRGPWLVVLLLPLAALGFRRGWLLGVVLLVVATVTPPQPAMASTWDDLWTRRDQQAAQALAAGEDARAAELATDPQQRGTAQYRAGQYEQSLESFSRATGPDAAYNQGNALARLGRYKEAIAAYDRALATQPHMEDAQHNKAVIEKLLQQQEEKKRQQQQQQGQQSGQSQSGEGQQQGNGDKSSTPSAQQEAQQKNGKSKDDSASQAANGNEARGDKAGKSPADAAPGSQDKSQANDEAAARNEAQPAGQKGAEPRDEHAAANTGQSSTPDTKKNPETIPEGNDSKSQAQAAGQESPKVEHQAAAERPAGEEPAENPVPSGAQAASDTHSTEEQQATEQWLRRIPDDPGGLLRRKFLYQYRQRAAGADRDVGQSW